jgi:ribokinase
MKHILVIGSSNTDLIVRVEEIPRPGETVLGSDLLKVQGGKGANQAVASARLGGRVRFIGSVGDDAHGAEALQGYREDGIDISDLKVCRGIPTGVALITVSDAGENAITVAPGANHQLTPEDLQRRIHSFSQAAVLLIQLEIPYETVMEAVKLASANGIPVILNPAPSGKLPDNLLNQIHILTPNQTEAQDLTGVLPDSEDSIRECCGILHNKGIEKVILTMGSRGAYLSDPSQGAFKLVRSFRVETVDTTAAGDVFNGALAVAISEGMNIMEAIRFANAAAAVSVRKMGAQPSIPQRKEIDRFLSGD